MSILTANYNPLNKTINNCEKGTLVYYHEYRHMQQDQKGLLGFYFGYQIAFVVPCAILILINPLYIYLFLAVWVIYMTFIEMDAWIYSLKVKR